MKERTVHLVRHVPPVRTGLLLGHCDIGPSVRDCPLLRAQVTGLSIRSVVSSDLSRAAEPAGILATAMGRPLILSQRWRELDFGEWDGLSPIDVDQAALSAFWDDPEANAPPRGERWSHLCERVARALTELGDKALVITHAGAMRAAISVLTGLDTRGVWALDLPYRARLTLRIWPGQPLAGQIVGLDAGKAP